MPQLLLQRRAGAAPVRRRQFHFGQRNQNFCARFQIRCFEQCLFFFRAIRAHERKRIDQNFVRRFTGHHPAGFGGHHPDRPPFLGRASGVDGTGGALPDVQSRGLDALEQSHETLNQRVAEKSHELGVNHERLRQIEQQQAALEERSHILRDMHDGLGTKLMISLRSLERGEIDSDKAAAVVRECIDELRLIVDASGQTDGDIAGLLANLRYRLGERLQRAGLAIEWRVTDTPPVPALTGGNGQELMHIVQACLNNILQHANASAITFETQYLTDDKNVVLSIRDNGRGFDAFAATNIADHGIANMRMRAERLGAMLAVISAPTGSEIRLTFPLVVSSKH